ncbi:TPA: hypothetical protein ACLUNC_002179, partial [Neisseria gonorrhoeae]
VSVAPDKFLKLKISSFPQGQKTKNRNLKFVIPAKAGIQFVEFRSFPINSYCFSFLDSHFRGNDGISVSVRTNVCAGMTKLSARKPAEMRQLPFARNTTRRFQMLSKKTELFKK